MKLKVGTTAAAVTVFLWVSGLGCGKQEPAPGEASDASAGAELAASAPKDDPATGDDAGERFSLAGNAERPKDNKFCFVCHEGLMEEVITTVHSAEGILCIDCHGPSTLHMEDEMSMTKPDYLHGREEVVAFCENCHGPHKDPLAVSEFREEWWGRDRPNGRVINAQSICTDCHGTHNVAGRIEDAESKAARTEAAGWVPLFNGKDLTGWETVGNASWTVEDGLLVGKQGEGNAPGDLLTEATFKDFMLTATYKVEWPCNSGIWFRYQSPKQAYQADILEWPDPECYSGTLYCPGKMFLAMNTDKNLVDQEGWNTLSIRAEGERLQIWLNGTQVADVTDDTSAEGKIGIQVHPGDQFASMKITISEINIQPLDGP